MNHVTVGPPWTLVSCQESDHESSWMWTHPCGAVLSVQSREGDVAELVAGITMPPGADDTDVTVPGLSINRSQPSFGLLGLAELSSPEASVTMQH